MITLHNGSETIELLTDDNSYSYEAVMGEDTLTLYFSHPGYLNVPVGSWCEFYGKRYSLKKDSNFKKNGERNYSYTLVLETSKADTELWKIRNTVDNRIKFPYTAKPKEHLKLIVDNLNRRSSGWVIGECIEGTEKLINYNHTVCLDALSQLAETYEIEYQITETVIEGVHTKTVHLKKVEYNKDNPLTLSYGKGHGFKTGVGRESGDIPPEIILVETTDRNIDYSKYGAKELLMPKSQTIRYDGTRFEGEEGFNASASRTYKTDEYGTSVMRADRELTTSKEDSLDCTEIYPSRVGEVSKVTTINTEKHFYDFYDTGIPNNLNFEDCLIEGEKMTVIFQSGMLSGKEFEVKYTHVGRKFEIVPQEIDGITMPDGGVWMPEVGDKYAVFGIQLPEAYISDNATRTGASWDVFREAVKYLYEHEDKKFTFTGTLDGIWAKKRWLTVGGKIVLGGFVSFTDNQFHPEGSLIRIVGIKRYVNNPYSPEIELSNTPVGTSVTSELNKIETNEVQVEENHKQALQFTKRYYRDAKETMEMLADSLLSFSGAINPITVATMQMLVGDEGLQYRFVNSKTNPVVVNHDINYNSSTKVLNAPAGIIQHMTLGITSLSNTHAASDYKYWDMAEYNSPSLTNPEKKFYLYAKCSKDNQSGMFLLSETAIALEQIDGYYHLLVGILNSENNGERSFATLYGFTEILPGRVTTEKIVSSDGKTYFDLVANEIAGRIRFLDGLISGLVGIGNNDGINAGMSGEGNSGSDVRIWAGANEANRWGAPFRVLHSGKLIGTDVDLSGIIHLNAEYLKISNGIDIDSGSLITRSAHLVLPEIEGDYSRVIRWVVPMFTRVIIQIRLETANSSVLIAPNGDALNPVSSFTIDVGMDSGEIVGFKRDGYTYWSVFKHMHEEL
ncbi:hypothetical protein [Bacteroides clarus]|uniref:hypothetical protein n=1 Tax=Bacteroides clarus TaxID=626929 RepID=UPI00241E6578|nr:hypothetical protein [Bacteroides clarus]